MDNVAEQQTSERVALLRAFCRHDAVSEEFDDRWLIVGKVAKFADGWDACRHGFEHGVAVQAVKRVGEILLLLLLFLLLVKSYYYYH